MISVPSDQATTDRLKDIETDYATDRICIKNAKRGIRSKKITYKEEAAATTCFINEPAHSVKLTTTKTTTRQRRNDILYTT